MMEIAHKMLEGGITMPSGEVLGSVEESLLEMVAIIAGIESAIQSTPAMKKIICFFQHWRVLCCVHAGWCAGTRPMSATWRSTARRENGQCPHDVHKKNGNPCGTGTGYCFNGVCPTLNIQCEQIWGYGMGTF
ncbi:hypothetical protein PR048_033065 [Dryococelus australis]|uniref:ADAM cysteine-rich domain-containing protein n=1 Tax=Dryococelus australis TaxID=614101 RepID=A0ABQ9FZ78_9NEOP|nr:hypothetical protein PR048_033065 [Dryococelus australis]